MWPSASAYTVLLEELAFRSITFRYSTRVLALVRRYDCCSASTGFCISRTLIHLPSAARTIGPWWVRYTVTVHVFMPEPDRYGRVIRSDPSGRSLPAYL